jgi:hypothetical protein
MVTSATSATNSWRPHSPSQVAGPRELEVVFLASRRSTNLNGDAGLGRRGTEQSVESSSNFTLVESAPGEQRPDAVSSRGPSGQGGDAATVTGSGTATPPSDLTSSVVNDFQKLWQVVSSMRLMTLLSFLLTLTIGIATWVGSNTSNKWSQGSYDIAFYQLCDTDAHVGAHSAKIQLALLTTSGP